MTPRTPAPIKRLATGVSNLDELLHGGVPENSLIVVAGIPGAGKTILTQQIALRNASPERPVIFFQTLSEPTVKVLRYIQQFSFFDQEQLERSSHFIDLGGIMRTKGLEMASEMIMEHVRKIRPGFVVIDSFKVFSELAGSREDLRKFSYKILTDLVAWECATFLLGEFTQSDIESNPIFSIVDGIFILSAQEVSGEQQRFLQIAKMRGTDHDRDKHPLVIGSDGVKLYVPQATIERERGFEAPEDQSPRRTGISSFDQLIGKGIRAGSSCLISGATGTGKTLFLLEFLYRGATEFKEKGIYFSFSETRSDLIAAARAIGMDLSQQIDLGMIEIVEIAQPEILVERDLLEIQRRVETLKAKRVAIDSLSGFLHKINEQSTVREKIFQLTRLIRQAGAIGFLSTDVAYASSQLSYFGVEETVVDGVILLSTILEETVRQRYLEIFKLRTASYSSGMHKMTIGPNGFEIQSESPR